TEQLLAGRERNVDDARLVFGERTGGEVLVVVSRADASRCAPDERGQAPSKRTVRPWRECYRSQSHSGYVSFCSMTSNDALSVLASTFAMMLAAPHAEASGFLNPRIADPHGHPALSNPYAVYFNPAALGGIEGTQIVLDGTFAYRTVDVDRAPSALSPLSMQALQDPTYRASNTGPSHAG